MKANQMEKLIKNPTIHFFFFTLLFTTGFSMLDPQDFLALQSIRKSLIDMPGSTFFSSWDFTSDPCTFSGVTCDPTMTKVVSLNLGDSTAGSPGLEGRLHPSLGKLSSLTQLTLVPGRVMGALPQSITQLSRLRFLAISRNFISGSTEKLNLRRLRLLQTLDLSYNQLTGSIPRSLRSLPSLSNLILCHNHLTGSIPSFSSKALIRLDLKHNNLSGSLPYLPSSLHYLSVSSNKLTGSIDRVLTRLTRINYLDLSYNHFTGPVPGSLFTYPLTNLQLQRNQFSGWIKPPTRISDSLATADLSHNRLTGQISSFLSSVRNLYLNNNRFVGQVPGSFVERLMDEGMEVLYLQHNYLTGIEINPTAEIPVSSSLCLQYNCMVPPVQTPCPVKVEKQRARPAVQCMKWKG